MQTQELGPRRGQELVRSTLPIQSGRKEVTLGAWERRATGQWSGPEHVAERTHREAASWGALSEAAMRQAPQFLRRTSFPKSLRGTIPQQSCHW